MCLDCSFYANRRRGQTPLDRTVHVYVNDGNCHHGSTQRISRRHHHRSLEMCQVFRPLAGLPKHVLKDAVASWQWHQRQISGI